MSGSQRVVSSTGVNVGEIMEGRNKSDTPKSRAVLMVCAAELCRVVENGLDTKVKIVQTSDPAGALDYFYSERPALIICGVDNEGDRFNPMFRSAAHYGVPVIALASTREAVEAVEGVTHFLDKRAVRAVVTLSQRLLDNPEFVPGSITSYPPPPKNTEVEKKSASGVKVVQATVVSSPPSSQDTNGKLMTNKTASVNSLQEKIENMETVDISALLVTQAEMLVSLQKRVDALEGQTSISLADNGKFINAVAAESAAFHAELKAMIAAVEEKNKRALDDMRGNLNGTLSLLNPSEKQLDVNLERISMSMVERQSQIEALEAAIFDVQTKDAQRDSNFHERIDELVQQITRLESEPPPAAHHDGNGTIDNVIAEFETRFAEIETALARIETAGTNGGGSGSSSFAQEFESLWGTQINLKELEKRISKLEHVSGETAAERRSFSPNADDTENSNSDLVAELKRIQTSLKTRLGGMEKRFASVETTLTELERRSEVMAKAPPQAQLTSFIQRLSALESKFRYFDENQISSAENRNVKALEIFETRIDQIEEMMREVVRNQDFRREVEDDALLEESDRESRPTLRGTIRAWNSDSPDQGRVVQRSIIKASSTPPTANSVDLDDDTQRKYSEKGTLIGVDSPVPKNGKV